MSLDLAATISPHPPTNKGIDYEYLREKGVRIVQKLSSEIWTDYNEHDPGVTTLEQLCYALTELSWRAEFDIADLLAQPETGRIDLHRHGLYTAREILPCNPVTLDDYRKLIADEVPGVANVWLTPLISKAPSREPVRASREVSGLYDIVVYVPNAHHPQPDCGRDEHTARIRRLKQQVRGVYCRHRNLCEDLHAVRLLKPVHTVISADVSLRERIPAERAMANILFEVGKLLAPELTRQSLNDLLAAGKTPDEIFNGPLLRQGFICDDELTPKAASVAVNDVIAAIARTEGVASAREVEVRTASGAYRLNNSVPIPADRYLQLDTKSREHGHGFPIRLLRNGVVCHPDPDSVARELSLLWAAYRRKFPLELQYDEYFGAPRGEWRDVTRYYSIQNQYPGIYGISAWGLPPDANAKRRGQAKQLKGYLLAFEQLMADYFAQLGEVGNLFSIRPDPWQTYYSQSLVKSVPNVEPVLASSYEQGLKEIVGGEANSLERRNRFLGHLLSLYANNLSAVQSGCESLWGRRRREEKLLRARLELMRLLVPATRFRGRGFNYRAKPSPRNIAGMEIKCRIELGLDLQTHRPLRDELAGADMRLTRGGQAGAGGGLEKVDDQLRPITEHAAPANVPASPSRFRGTSISEAFIDAGRKPANLLVGFIPGTDTVVLVCRIDSTESVIIDVFANIDEALREAWAIVKQSERIHRARTQMYVVEHTLLRFGRRRSRTDDPFLYSFTITAVVSLPKKERLSRDDRTKVAEIVRENTPAHIAAAICFLDPCRLLTFEHLYREWQDALRSRNTPAIRRSSARLRRFLERQRRSTVVPNV